MRHPRNGVRSTVCISRILPGRRNQFHVHMFAGATYERIGAAHQALDVSFTPQTYAHRIIMMKMMTVIEISAKRLNSKDHLFNVIRTKPWISSRSSDPTTSCTLAQVQKEFWHFSGGGGDLLQGQWKNLAMAVVHKYKECGHPVLKGNCNFSQGQFKRCWEEHALQLRRYIKRSCDESHWRRQ